MWQMDGRYGVVYLEDRKLLQVLLGMEKFPARHEGETLTYTNAKGRVYAWQASFEMSLWNRVVRALGREAVEIVREPAPPRARASRVAPAAVPPAARNGKAPAPGGSPRSD